MKCMCAQTRPRFILSSERVFWGMEFEPMLTPREKSPLPENFPRGGSNPRRCGQRAQTLPTSYSGPRVSFKTKFGGLLKICSLHQCMRHSRERGSNQRYHHTEREEEKKKKKTEQFIPQQPIIRFCSCLP